MLPLEPQPSPIFNSIFMHLLSQAVLEQLPTIPPLSISLSTIPALDITRPLDLITTLSRLIVNAPVVSLLESLLMVQKPTSIALLLQLLKKTSGLMLSLFLEQKVTEILSFQHHHISSTLDSLTHRITVLTGPEVTSDV